MEVKWSEVGRHWRQGVQSEGYGDSEMCPTFSISLKSQDWYGTLE